MAGLEPAPARLSTARPHAPLAQARSRSIVRPRPSAVQRPAPQPHHSASRTFFMQKAAEQADAKASEPRSPPTSPNRRSTTSRRSSTSSWEKAAASLEGNRSVFDDDDAFYDKCAAANEASKSPKRQKPPLGKPKRAISPSAVPKPDPGGRLVTATPHRLLGSALSEDERPHDRLDDVRLCAGRSTGDWYTLQLKARPKAAVRISISSASDSVVVTPTNVFFAPDDWSKPRHVLVSARPAGDAPARHHKGAGAAHVKVFHYVISDDSNFHNAPLAPLIVHSLAGASDAVISFGAADDGQLGLGEFRPSSALRQLDSYHHVEIPHALSTEFHDMHRDAIEHAPAIQSVAARRENAAALEQLSGSAVVGDADFQAACKSSVYEDADATRAAHISSDSDIPRDGMKFDKYSSLTLSKRHDGSARNGGDRVLTLGGGARHSVVVTANGAMYTCGDNAQGQLGVGDTIQRRAMTRVVFAPMPEAPPRRDWASAARHGVAASFDKDRPVYDGGTPTSFADGRSPTSFADVASEKQTQTFADVAQKVRQRWLPRGSKRPPTKHALFSKHRVSVAVVGCGPGHTMAISIDGVLFSWGHNTNGQLGTGDTRDRYAPFKVELPGLGVVAATLVSCGAAHTICAGLEGEARSGVLYSWGSAVSGALGLGMLESEKDVLEPRLVAGMAGVAVHFLSCGSYHTALIDGDGDVFTCGLPEDGRLGRLCDGADDDAGKREERDSARSNAVFAKVLLPRDRRLAGARLKCIAVACGGSHTLLLASSRGVYACGDNARGQLGLGSRLGCRSKPQLVQMLCGRSICGLAAGATHSAAWTEAGLVYGWGEATCGQLGAKAEQGGAAVVMPNLLPVLSYARTRQLCFGGAHTLCVTEHSLHAVRRIVNSSRQFKIDAVKHLKMVAKYERFVDSSIIDPEAPKRQLSDADIGRNASQGDRRNWTRRCKLYKVVHFIDVEILINKVAQTKLIHAVQRAALAKVLHVKPAKHVYLRETAGLGKKGQAAKAQAADNFGAANEAGANEAFANKAVEAPAEPRRQRPSSAAPTAASAASKRPASARQAAARRQAAFQDEKTATKLRQANALTHRKADAAVTLACRLDRSDELLVQPVTAPIRQTPTRNDSRRNDDSRGPLRQTRKGSRTMPSRTVLPL
ncbi:regulator of chromosome condensation 1/beta-lactamase-inhibitor protein II [Pelagophyceae sp. CCMP2097]|nr:regulator of chromosome condensation 1/beta-lactamase-inhibitor protein II [Pelagophyceae sp. CCMP2097]